jgi:uncharacterized DUF497 family protein
MFEWDERKRRANVLKHRVDFSLVVEIFEGDYVEIEDDRSSFEEPRYRALGTFEGQSYVVVYTWRQETRRIISAWRVGERGKRRYQALFARRASRDAGSR